MSSLKIVINNTVDGSQIAEHLRDVAELLDGKTIEEPIQRVIPLGSKKTADNIGVMNFDPRPIHEPL